MKIKVWASTNRVGSRTETEIDVEDDCTPDEIEEQAKEAAFQMVDWSWEPVE